MKNFAIADSSMALSVTLATFLTVGHLLLLILADSPPPNCFNSIFSFGDSITDTGNLLYVDNESCPAGHQPYGETFFNHPTGRFSDGRLIIDFLAEALGVPFVPPYLPHSSSYFKWGANSSSYFEWGANFAVGGATALDTSSFNKSGIPLHSPYSLSVQVSWFHRLLLSICSSQSDCKARLKRTLIMVGEIGANDYGYAFRQDWSVQQVIGLVPKVIEVTESAITSLIDAGATSILVQGMLAFGCLPSSLTKWSPKTNHDYDNRTGCVIELNELGEFHDQLLVEMMERLGALNSEVTIVLADFYHSSMPVFESPNRFGIKEPLKACCGAGGPYNYHSLHQCGETGILTCDDPDSYLSWDGVHGTEALHRVVTQGWQQGPYNILPIFSNCATYVAQA